MGEDKAGQQVSCHLLGSEGHLCRWTWLLEVRPLSRPKEETAARGKRGWNQGHGLGNAGVEALAGSVSVNESLPLKSAGAGQENPSREGQRWLDR